MATQALMPVEEYLQKHFEDREPEYRDGILEERPVPTYLHSLLQVFFTQYLVRWTDADAITVCTELRLRLRDRRFVVPDVCIFAGAPPGPLPDALPLAVVEVLSPDDSPKALLLKLAEYHDWGVANIWVVNPDTRSIHTFNGTELQVTDAFALPAFNIVIPQEEVFRKVNARFPKSS